MTYFFGTSRHPDCGLSDATNLLSTRSMKREQQQQPASASLHFSAARRLLCFAGGGADRYIGGMESPTLSPSPAVATAWMEMETTSNKSSSSRPTTTERSSSTRGSSCDRSITTQPASSSRIPYCGSRRMPTPDGDSDARPQLKRSSHSRSATGTGSSRPTRTATKHKHKLPMNNSKRTSEHEWKSAVDPKSGRTYYYNERTRETQWRMPVELASPAERKEMAMKDRKQKEFFAAMERNILRNIAQGQVSGTSPMEEDKKQMQMTMPSASSSSALEKPRLVKTISGMNDSILRELVKRVPSTRITTMPREESLVIDDLMIMKKEDLTVLKESGSNSPMDTGWADLDFDANDDSDSSPSAREESRVIQELAKTAEQMTLVSGSEIVTVTPDEPIMPKPKSLGLERPALEKPGLLGSRRNTCGTIYVGSTMSAPDKDATIKCVCGVYRAHILSEESFPTRLDDAKYRIFNDHEADRITFIQEDVQMEDAPSHDMPSLEEITNFYRNVFRRAQMESDTIIMSLIYVERLIKVTDGGLRPTRKNWRSLLFSCMILSSKVWDDLSMWNADFSQTCPSRVKFSLSRINKLELAVLNALSYKVKVPASEYAKYYFLLRSMLIKSGLGGDDLKTMNPLDVEGAKQLEQVSSNFQATAATKRRVAQQEKLRSKSMGHVDAHDTSQGQDKKASLEHMVKM